MKIIRKFSPSRLDTVTKIGVIVIPIVLAIHVFVFKSNSYQYIHYGIPLASDLKQCDDLYVNPSKRTIEHVNCYAEANNKYQQKVDQLKKQNTFEIILMFSLPILFWLYKYLFPVKVN